jgi:hypothetical protein
MYGSTMYGQPPPGYGVPTSATPVSSGQPYGAPGQYGGPTQYGNPGQYGDSGQYGAPGQYGDPATYGHDPAFGEPPQSAGPAPKSRRGLIIGLVIGAVLLLLAIAGTGITIALNRSSTNFAVNSCVKRDGDKAVKAGCSDKGAYTVVSKVDKKESCPDQNQPFVVLPDDNDRVLCLRPAKS